MKKVISLLVFFFIAGKIFASSILASSFGYNTTNATAAFQSAILSANDTVVVDLQAADWNVGPSIFFSLTNKVIIFEPKVKLKAISGTFNATNACLIEFKYCNNITVIGYQAEFKMNKAEYALLNDSEYRMSININDSKNITIKGLTLNESGGDGIYIGGDGVGYCENILIEDVICTNHYRQGMSITNVQNMMVKNSKFTNTQGTLPEAGVDVEPYQTNQRIANLQFEKCAFEGNGWAGLALALFELDSTSVPVSIGVKDCYFKNNCLPANAYGKCEIFLSAHNNIPVKGNVLFERCFIDGSQYTALYTRKTADAYDVKFKDCAFQNVSQKQTQYNEPIFLEVPSYTNPSGYLGGLEFENVFISYPTNFGFFRVFGWSTLQGIKNINGNFTIVEPNNNPVLYSNVPDTVNVTYSFTNQTVLPATTVHIKSIASTAFECSSQPAVYSFGRASSNIGYPLGLNYSNIGTVVFGDDVHLMTGGFVIPSNTTSRADSTVARQDLIVEPVENFTLTILPSTHYNIGTTSSVNLMVEDCNALGLNNQTDNRLIALYPNPSSGVFVFSQKNTSNTKIEIYNNLCELIYQTSISTQQSIIDLSGYAKGLYFVRATDTDKNVTNLKIVVQ